MHSTWYLVTTSSYYSTKFRGRIREARDIYLPRQRIKIIKMKKGETFNVILNNSLINVLSLIDERTYPMCRTSL